MHHKKMKVGHREKKEPLRTNRNFILVKAASVIQMELYFQEYLFFCSIYERKTLFLSYVLPKYH